MEAVTPTLLTLPPHLLEKIQALVEGDVDLPQDLRRNLQGVYEEAKARNVLSTSDDDLRDDGIDQGQAGVEADGGDGSPESQLNASPDVKQDSADGAVIDEDVLLRLSRWTGLEGRQKLKDVKLDPEQYSMISLLAGTQVYLTPERLAFLKTAENPDKPNPYLPSYLSPPEPLFSGYRALSKQISTILNVIFSIVGTGFAVYMAAITGAGYTKEKGVLLGILAAIIVGIAEAFLLWVFVGRVEKGRKDNVEMWRGTASEGPKHIEAPHDGSETIHGLAASVAEPQPERRSIRLRRRAIHEGT